MSARAFFVVSGTLAGGCNFVAGIQEGRLVAGDAATDPPSSGSNGGHSTTPEAPLEATADGSVTYGAVPNDSASDSPVGDSSPDSTIANDSAVTDATAQADAPAPCEGGPACMMGTSCSPAQCQFGSTSCPKAGAFSCTFRGVVQTGTSCENKTGVCNDAGVCSACAAGTDCSDAGSCAAMTIGCATGSPVCSSSGNEPDGTHCGANQYCKAGACLACSQGSQRVVTPGNGCASGSLDCVSGTCTPERQCGCGHLVQRRREVDRAIGPHGAELRKRPRPS